MQQTIGNANAEQAGRGSTQSGGRGALDNNLFEIKLYVFQNPAPFHAVSFCCGFVLTLLSFIGLLPGVQGIVVPSQHIICLYNMIFGIIIMIVDGKQGIVDKCCGIQTKTFQHFPFLLRRYGRACFYVYVGTLIIFTVPTHVDLKTVFIISGCTMFLLAIWMLVLMFVDGRRPHVQFTGNEM